VRNSSSVSIANSTISYNGRNGISSGVFIVGTSTQIEVSYNVIDNNAGNGVTVQEDFVTKDAPTMIMIKGNTIWGNGFVPGDGVGIHVVGAVTYLRIEGCEIYNNAAQGILVERAVGSNGPQNLYIGINNDVIPPTPSYIYSNGQEGILIRDPGTSSNFVQLNVIGIDPLGNPAPNGNSGVSLFGGTTNNTIEANTIRYNQYQDVLISGTGTSNNTVQNQHDLGRDRRQPPRRLRQRRGRHQQPSYK
jgi:hypothetical protein